MDLIVKGFDLTGTGGDDTITGTNTVDRIIGGSGNDTLAVCAGNDIYYYNLGDGSDTILDIAGTDILRFDGDIAPDSLATETSGNDLLIQVGDELLTIQNWFLGPDYRIENIQFSDGSSCRCLA